MDYLQVELNDVRMSFKNGHNYSHRTERISELTFAYVKEMIERELLHLGADMVVEHIDVPPIQVSFQNMDDESIAHMCATGIYRALMQML